MSLINEKIKKARETKRLTQSEVADSIEVSTRMYQRYEKDIEPSLDIIAKLSSIFEVDLINNTPKPKDDPDDLKAVVKALLFEVAWMKSEKEGIPFEDAVKAIRKNTTLVRGDLDF